MQLLSGKYFDGESKNIHKFYITWTEGGVYYQKRVYGYSEEEVEATVPKEFNPKAFRRLEDVAEYALTADDTKSRFAYITCNSCDSKWFHQCPLCKCNPKYASLAIVTKGPKKKREPQRKATPLTVLKRSTSKKKAAPIHIEKLTVNVYRQKITGAKRSAVYNRDDYKCIGCGFSQLGLLTVDHLIPLAYGGNNEIWNLGTMCVTCNLKKGDKLINKYVELSQKQFSLSK